MPESITGGKSFEDILFNPINFNGLIGLSMGLEHIRLFGHYQYGFNNILNKINDIEGTTNKFKGHLNLIQFGVLFYF